MNDPFEYVTCDNTPPTVKMFTAGRQTQLGSFEVEVDGYYVFYPHFHGGCWTQYFLQILAQKLESLNAVWDAEVKKSLGSF